ncbi:MAG: hypothetical protein A2W28_11920 [Gammaproteobacteria bacterium RBG_16_51_14]|nr:MAG: hypothetical protein A2W28_11920 [Gammaproteobacteria bacterium RBG_16_51_14]
MKQIDWSVTTWEGSRREQLRRARRLTLRERLAALEDMEEFAEFFRQSRRKRNLPVIESDRK